MLKMFTLVKREIIDHIAYFFGAFMLSAIFIMISIPAAYRYDPDIPLLNPVALILPIILLLTIGFAGMGVSQMYTDKNRGISAFLSTLPVTRDQILTARIVAGILAILTLFVPLAITTFILYKLVAPPIPIYEGLFFDIYTLTILMSVACYCIGLLNGWTSGKRIPTLDSLILACIFVPIVIIKGLGLETSAILILFIIASFIRIRQKFLETSL